MIENPISKVQEREALEQIMDIIEKIGGDDSYIGMAMKGLYEIAISNIENDFGDNLLDARAKEALQRAKDYEDAANNAKTEVSELERYIEKLQADLSREISGRDEYIESERRAQRMAESLSGDLHFAKQEIIELKAKLYDYMIRDA